VKRDGQNITICAITERTRRCDDEGVRFARRR
jgi:hypothetical protein